jgi:protein-L-isoaspartate(D-aspartate) O-methyltransferase
VSDHPGVLSRRLLDQLAAQGEVTERWAAVLHAVPRHRYLPDVIYRHERGRPGNDLVPLHRAAEPERWLEMVYSDIPINTQVDDGNPAPDGTGFEVSSSSSQPSVVTGMLTELGARAGERVLEIGTGTGWNAALLAHTVGAENVTTIEVDPAVAAHARAALDATGYGAVTTIVGDGAVGWPNGAPYDRVISTVGVAAIPYAWVEQTKPGGRIVAPLTNSYRSPGVVALTRHGDGSASGRLAGPAAFMMLRAEREPRVRGTDFVDPPETKSTTQVHPHDVTANRAAAIAIGFRVAGVSWSWQSVGDLGVLWFYAPKTRSRASLELLEQPPYLVEQAGPRRLWDEVADAYAWWLNAGEPGVRDWLVSVDRNGQRIELSP